MHGAAFSISCLAPDTETRVAHEANCSAERQRRVGRATRTGDVAAKTKSGHAPNATTRDYVSVERKSEWTGERTGARRSGPLLGALPNRARTHSPTVGDVGYLLQVRVHVRAARPRRPDFLLKVDRFAGARDETDVRKNDDKKHGHGAQEAHGDRFHAIRAVPRRRHASCPGSREAFTA